MPIDKQKKPGIIFRAFFVCQYSYFLITFLTAVPSFVFTLKI